MHKQHTVIMVASSLQKQDEFLSVRKDLGQCNNPKLAVAVLHYRSDVQNMKLVVLLVLFGRRLALPHLDLNGGGT